MKDSKVPLRLIALLADGISHSGGQLGELLGVSRAAINKYIQIIREWGVNVFTMPGKGYILANPIQLLEVDRILKLLQNKRVIVLPVVNSTNQYLLDRIYHLQSGDASIAEYQQAGRGRRGRQWVSPFGANLYLSMFWCLKQGSAAAMGLSLVIGIVIAEVLRSIGAKDVRVKWPNDLYLKGRKLAGILIEMISNSSNMTYLVIGAGINIAMCSANSDTINQGWINLQDVGVIIDRNELAAKLLNKLRQSLKQFESDGLRPFVARWHLLDNFINRPVQLLIGEQQIFGIARGIDEQGALLLDQQGIIRPFIGEQISLRDSE
ncbi:biotin--protein ligase [Serratia symbiotica str. 'Cinara cedri']|nr:biotin--protein ligase [Serratia symbiotica str. 'Cinara cedri']